MIIMIIIIIIMAIYKAPVSAASDVHGASLHNNQNNIIWVSTLKQNSEFGLCHVVRHGNANSIQNPSTATNPTMEPYNCVHLPLKLPGRTMWQIANSLLFIQQQCGQQVQTPWYGPDRTDLNLAILWLVKNIQYLKDCKLIQNSAGCYIVNNTVNLKCKKHSSWKKVTSIIHIQIPPTGYVGIIWCSTPENTASWSTTGGTLRVRWSYCDRIPVHAVAAAYPSSILNSTPTCSSHNGTVLCETYVQPVRWNLDVYILYTALVRLQIDLGQCNFSQI